MTAPFEKKPLLKPVSCRSNILLRELFSALWTDAVRELGPGMLPDELLEPFPVTLVIFYLLAIGAYRQETA